MSSLLQTLFENICTARFPGFVNKTKRENHLLSVKTIFTMDSNTNWPIMNKVITGIFDVFM